MLTCSRCNNEVDKPGYCPECRADYRKLYAKPVSYYGPEEVRKHQARLIANRALKKGVIKRQPCEVPGCSQVAEMHHEDYTKPLEVTWICKPHHKGWHRIMNGKFLRDERGTTTEQHRV